MIFIVSNDIYPELYRELLSYGKVFLLKSSNLFLKPESKHADLQVFNYDNKTAYTIEGNNPDLDNFLMENKISVNNIKINSPKYPDCVKLNILKANNAIIANTKTAEESIISKYKKIINVPQGYTRCNAIYIDPFNMIITGDKGIKKHCERNGYSVYLANNENVVLNGYPNGFLPGAMFFSSTLNTLFVNGSLSCYDFNLYEILSKYIKIVECKAPINDIGSGIIFD